MKHPKEAWTVRPNAHEAIIDRDRFERAQQLLDRGKKRPKGEPGEGYLFASLLRCSKCGATLHALAKRRRETDNVYYECSTHKWNNAARIGNRPCEGTTVKERDVLLSLAEHLDNELGLGQLADAAYFGHLTPESVKDFPATYKTVRAIVSQPAASGRERQEAS